MESSECRMQNAEQSRSSRPAGFSFSFCILHSAFCILHSNAATGFSGKSRPRRLKIAEPSGCKSRAADPPSLQASARQAGVWLIGNSRPVRLKIEQPWALQFAKRTSHFGKLTCKAWEAHSPHADQSGMSTGRASRTCLLKQWALRKGSVVRVHGIPPCARSSKRAAGLRRISIGILNSTFLLRLAY